MKLESLSIKLDGEKLFLLDQQQLPHQEVWVDATTVKSMDACIKSLTVRGAPAIGVAAALCLGLCSQNNSSVEDFVKEAQLLRQSRPTAVNLMIAIDRILAVVESEGHLNSVWDEALKIFKEDVELCERIANKGEPLIEDGDSILTHCNTGGLATAGVGTALGVIRKAFEGGKNIHVYVDETRPLLQGGRLTAWELKKLGIPYTLICDNMAAYLMSQGKIQKAIVGADRIALNGDFANKVGTYSVALSCHHHKVPFYVAAPYTTVDVECQSAKDIPIELRNDKEVRGVHGSFGEVQWAPEGAEVFNPAFDVTPAPLVSAWVLDRGVFKKCDIDDGILNNN